MSPLLLEWKERERRQTLESEAPCQGRASRFGGGSARLQGTRKQPGEAGGGAQTLPLFHRPPHLSLPRAWAP